MELRRRMDADLDACVRLAQVVQQADGYPPRLPGDLARFVAAPGALGAWVVDGGGGIVGHVALAGTSSPEVMALASQATGLAPERLAVVTRLFVAPGHRRQGVAGWLLAAAVEGAHVLGCWPVLDVAAHFSGAIALYEASGWVRAGTVTVPIRADDPLDEVVFVGPAPPAT